MAKVKVQNFNENSSHTVICSKDLFAETCALAGRPEAPIEDYFKVGGWVGVLVDWECTRAVVISIEL